MSVRNERDQEVTEGLQIRGRGRSMKKAYSNSRQQLVGRRPAGLTGHQPDECI